MEQTAEKEKPRGKHCSKSGSDGKKIVYYHSHSGEAESLEYGKRVRSEGTRGGEELVETEALMTVWTMDDWKTRLEAICPRTAVFDCDGTLWSGDSGYGFMRWSMEQGLISREMSEWMDERHRAYEAGKVGETQICGEMVQVYAGLREEEIRGASETFVQRFVRGRHFHEMEEIVALLRERGAELWAVSSTHRWVIEAGVAAFGIAAGNVLAAAVRVADGRLTEKLEDVPTDEAKAAALRRVGIAAPDAVFGNSVHDVAMLEMARLPVPVNASAGLRSVCVERGWKILQPSGAGESEDIVME